MRSSNKVGRAVCCDNVVSVDGALFVRLQVTVPHSASQSFLLSAIQSLHGSFFKQYIGYILTTSNECHDDATAK